MPTQSIPSAAKLAIYGAVVSDTVNAGAALGIKPVFLKGVWADAVLFGGEGVRLKGDVDVLVERTDFLPLAKALYQLGYRYAPQSTHRASIRWASKEWALKRGALPCIDLHWALADSPWFKWPAKHPLERAFDYYGPGGVIRSLCPNDQVLYAAAHYANHRYALSDGHLKDIVAMLKVFEVQWETVRDHAEQSGLAAALWFLEAALVGAGVQSIPPWSVRRLADTLRTTAASFWVNPEDLNRRANRAWPWDNVLRMPLPLLTGPGAFAAHLAKAGVFGVIDRFFRAFPHLNWDKPDLR